MDEIPTLLKLRFVQPNALVEMIHTFANKFFVLVLLDRAEVEQGRKGCALRAPYDEERAGSPHQIPSSFLVVILIEIPSQW